MIFSDRSSQTKHRRIIHGVRVQLAPCPTSGCEMRFAPYSVPKIEEHSGQGMTSFRITTPSLYDPAADDDKRPTLGASSSSTNDPSYMRPCELPGIFHRAQDVCIGRTSVDTQTQLEHQQANAKHRLHHEPPVSAVAGTAGPQPSREWHRR